MKWYDIDLTTITELDNSLTVNVPEIGEMTLRFVRVDNYIGWVINGQVLFAEYFQTPDAQYGFYFWQDHYQIGFPE